LRAIVPVFSLQFAELFFGFAREFDGPDLLDESYSDFHRKAIERTGILPDPFGTFIVCSFRTPTTPPKFCGEFHTMSVKLLA
jgi:hypothetical protein